MAINDIDEDLKLLDTEELFRRLNKCNETIDMFAALTNAHGTSEKHTTDNSRYLGRRFGKTYIVGMMLWAHFNVVAEELREIKDELSRREAETLIDE